MLLVLHVSLGTIILLNFFQVLAVFHLVMASLFEMIYVELHGIVHKFSKSPATQFTFPFNLLSQHFVNFESYL